MTSSPRDNAAHRFPVSVKGIVIRDGAVVLVYNARDEWELPGGKLELDEEPGACVAREIEEELGLAVRAVGLVDAWVYRIASGTDVLVISYGCVETAPREPMLSDEHRALRWVPLAALDSLPMPAGYVRSSRAWASRAAERA